MPRGQLDPNARHFGNVIQRMRNERGWSVNDFGKATGMHPDYLRLLERGLNVPSLNTILTIAEAFDVPAGTLLAPIEEERKTLRPTRVVIRRG